MVDFRQKEELLGNLIVNLQSMIKMLKLEPDPKRRFAPLFEPQLERAQDLLRSGFGFEDIKALSYSIEGLLDRSFLDYSPATFDASAGRFSPVPGTEEYGEVVARVSALAFELRVVGST